MKASQDQLAAALLDPSAPRPSGLSDKQGRAAGKRFDVYRNNVTVSLVKALDASFPVTRKLVGSENFTLLARAYARARPPVSPLMMFYGHDMPGFLERFEPVQAIRYLPDIARLEIALRESYHAADAAPISPDRIALVPPEHMTEITLQLVPSARLVRSAWPIHDIWMFNQSARAPKPAMAAQDVLVLRPDYDPEPVLLPPAGGTFVDGLRRGLTLGAALEAATAQYDAFDLTGSLTLLISKGAILDLGEKT